MGTMYKVTMLIRPKYKLETYQPIAEQLEEFNILMTKYGSGMVAHEITQGRLIIEEYTADEVTQ